MSATAADLRALRQAMDAFWRADYSRDLIDRRQRVGEFLLSEIAKLESPGARPQQIELVCKRVDDSTWQMGYARSPVTVTPRHGLAALQAAQAAFATPWQAVDLTPYIDASNAPS